MDRSPTGQLKNGLICESVNNKNVVLVPQGSSLYFEGYLHMPIYIIVKYLVTGNIFYLGNLFINVYNVYEQNDCRLIYTCPPSTGIYYRHQTGVLSLW